jgi:hypothetical protein
MSAQYLVIGLALLAILPCWRLLLGRAPQRVNAPDRNHLRLIYAPTVGSDGSWRVSRRTDRRASLKLLDTPPEG